jgi:hypothetical protein
MRNRVTSALVALVAVLVFLAVTRAQTAKPAAATAASSGSGPTVDLSGVWVATTPRLCEPKDGCFPDANSKDSKEQVYNPETDEADASVFRHIPYPMQPWAAEKYNQNRNSEEGSPWDAHCSPMGPTVEWLFQVYPIEIVQSPKRVLLLFERDHEMRHIWTDVRDHPKDFGHNWMGNTIGHWEGNTLVADTIGLNDLTWLDKAGHVHSDALHIIERFDRPSHDKLVLHITLDDPKAYTAPISAFRNFKLTNWDLDEDVNCEDKIKESMGRGKEIPLH